MAKIEIRFSSPLRDPKDKQLVIIPEKVREIAILDSFFGDNFRLIKGEFCIDDSFKPYIRIYSLSIR